MIPEPTSSAGLDWPVVVEAWAEQALTALGSAAVRAATPLADHNEVREAHAEIAEWLVLRDQGVDTGLGAVVDIRADAERGAIGEVLDDAELRMAGSCLVGLRTVAKVLDGQGLDAPRLAQIAVDIEIDAWTCDELNGAWDATGRLSAARWPRLGELREQIAQLHERVRKTLETMVRSDEMADTLQDSFWTQRERRYVLPMKHHAKGYDLGIVHGTSRTGQTVFIEPHEVIALNNAIRVAEGELAAEEHRIRAELSRLLGTQAPAIARALDAATVLDVIAARAGLARRLDCTPPSVGSGGAVELVAARHPVLVLRGVEVVPNDLNLSADHAALVISGPNAGGKTVALKTVGLCALLVQHGCWIPASEGSRVDYFSAVYASIGDQQTVEGDLSSFSGHLVTVGRILEGAGPGTLSLLDELMSGTDPAQGAALAQAVLETLLDRGARLVVTTHYARLKGLAAVDERFAMAATAYLDGQPTYRLISGTTGESRAFDLADRMGVDPAILDRARSLMDRGDAELAKALEGLETERATAEAESQRIQALRADLTQREAKMAKREAMIAARSKELEAKGAEAYLDRLKSAERAIGQVVAELQRNPSHKGVAAAKAAVGALGGLLPDEVSVEVVPAAPVSFAVGDRVKLILLNKVGEVLDAKPKAVKVRAGGLTLTVKPSQLERLGGPIAAPAVQRPSMGKRPVSVGIEDAIRMGSNTLDLRGKRLDDSKLEVEKFFDRCVLSGSDACFLLHGHGTGALKSGLRQWLSSCAYVSGWQPANEDQGGDAFTVVRLA